MFWHCEKKCPLYSYLRLGLGSRVTGFVPSPLTEHTRVSHHARSSTEYGSAKWIQFRPSTATWGKETGTKSLCSSSDRGGQMGGVISMCPSVPS